MNFLHSAVNQLFAIICSAIYGIMILVYKLFYSISNTGLIEESYQILAKNVYTILGVIMIFKLAFSIIQYIIDPDQFSNKENGFSALIKNVFIVLVLILVVPIAFSQARRLQIIILSEDIVGRVITGKNMSSLSSTDKDNNAENIGNEIAFNILSGFLRPDSDLSGCENTLNVDDDTMQQCIEAIKDKDSTAGEIYANALTYKSYKDLLSSEIMFSTFKNSQGKKVVTFDFNGIFASVCGGFTVYILFIFCIDIAVRSVKFSFLQMFAPIPIVSYIDPKSKKQVFDKWVKVSISTYLDLFIRLAAIYFAVYLIQIIISTGLETYDMDAAGNIVSSKPGVFVRIFMILGLLMFAKQLPNLIKDLTGLDLGGKFTLNPLKKIQDEALFGKQVAAGVGLAGRTARNIGIGAGLALGAPIGMGISAAGKMLGKGISNKYTDFRANHAGFNNALNKVGAGVQKRADYIKKWGEWTGASKHFNKIGSDIEGTVGASFTRKRDDRRISQLQNVTKAVDSMEERARKRITEGDAGDLSTAYREHENRIEALKNMSHQEIENYSYQYKDNNGNDHYLSGRDAYARQLADEQQAFHKWMEQATYQYIDANGHVSGTSKPDAVIEGLQKDYARAVEVAGEQNVASADTRHGQAGGFKGEVNDINRSRMAQQEAKK